MKYKDYYATLDVARDANLDLVKKAYRKLARQYHPDMSKEAGAEAKFKEAAEAYATLKDPEKRAAYDALGRRPAGQEFAPPPQWEQSHRAAQGSTQGFEDIDLADLMGAFGRRGHGDHGGQRAFALAGRDYDSKLAISLLDAHRGATLNLQLSADGEDRTLEVTVPAGVREGQKLRLRGKGGKGRNGGPDGDIYLHITLAPHAIFRADHHDLYFDLVLSPWEAALGSEIEVPTLDGPVMLTVPPGTHWGRKLRLRARGLAKGGDDGRGDLYALVHIDVPSVLSAEERTLYEQLGQVSAFRPRETAVKGEPNASPHR